LVQRQNFGDAWIEALYNAVTYGVDITFGSPTERKQARDTSQTIVLTGEAIKQLANCEIHPGTGKPGSGLGPLSCAQYKNECDREWYNTIYKLLPEGDKKKFVYLYIERLIETYCDQLAELRKMLADSIASGVMSNRTQAITWNPHLDIGNPAPPCFQRLWIRYYPENCIDVHISWRSRDLRNAFQENNVAIYGMVDREIAEPNGCRIIRVRDDSDSLHVYTGAISDSMEILRLEAKNNPNLMRQLIEFS
jgi:thymidylate synthase